MELLFRPEQSKEDVFTTVEQYLGSLSLKIAGHDTERPWGGFFIIDETSTDDFIETYFPDFDKTQIEKYGDKLSPKILIVAPSEQLSWQYHNRRAELWKVVAGTVGTITSDSDEQGPVQELGEGQTVQFDATVRHRLIGLENWGVVAEIWQHTDTSNPSDEDDIIRLSDNYGR